MGICQSERSKCGEDPAPECLKRFPIRTLKIDQSFIRDMTNDSDDAAIIAMAHQLKMQVIAEGVETEEQLAFLRSQQCDKMQGYLFSRGVYEAIAGRGSKL